MQSANPFLVEEVGGHTIEARKPGRPPGSTNTRPRTTPTRDVIKQIRWTPQEWQSIEAAAERSGEPVCVWQRETLLERTRMPPESQTAHSE